MFGINNVLNVDVNDESFGKDIHWDRDFDTVTQYLNIYQVLITFFQWVEELWPRSETIDDEIKG